MDRFTGFVVVVVVATVIADDGIDEFCWFFFEDSRSGPDRVVGFGSDLVAMAREASTSCGGVVEAFVEEEEDEEEEDEEEPW